MSQPFDAALKDIVRRHVADYAAEFNLPGMATVLDVDLSTVSAATDIVLADANPPQKAITTLDFQAGHDVFIDDRILMYQGLLRHRYHLPVHSVVLLLRPDTYRPPMTGRVRYQSAGGRGKIDFEFEMVRLWELPAGELLASGIGTAPLAILGRLPGRRDLQAGLEDIVRELDQRFQVETPAAEANDLRATVGVLLGLRVQRQVGKALLERVLSMEESVIYQLIIEKGEARGEARGKAEGARSALVPLAQRQLGRPSKKTLAALKAITDADRLARMNVALFDVNTWDELLAIE